MSSADFIQSSGVLIDFFFDFQTCIERMLNLTDHLRRLKVDNYEYVAMKVIVLLSSGERWSKETFDALKGFEVEKTLQLL